MGNGLERRKTADHLAHRPQPWSLSGRRAGKAQKMLLFQTNYS